MPILSSAKISKGFRVTIPKDVRIALELKEGEELVFFTMENIKGRVCFRKA